MYCSYINKTIISEILVEKSIHLKIISNQIPFLECFILMRIIIEEEHASISGRVWRRCRCENLKQSQKKIQFRYLFLEMKFIFLISRKR